MLIISQHVVIGVIAVAIIILVIVVSVLDGLVSSTDFTFPTPSDSTTGTRGLPMGHQVCYLQVLVVRLHAEAVDGATEALLGSGCGSGFSDSLGYYRWRKDYGSDSFPLCPVGKLRKTRKVSWGSFGLTIRFLCKIIPSCY